MTYSSRDVARRVRERLDATGMSAREASIKTGKSPDLIRNLFRSVEAGRDFTWRHDTFAALAPVLKTNVEWLLTGSGNPSARDTAPPVEQPAAFPLPVPLVGTVEPGVWRERIARPAEDVRLPADPRFPAIPQSGFAVRGDFAPACPIRNGMFVVSADYDAYRSQRGDLRSGDLVVLQRERPTGERELTLREVEVAPDQLSLKSVAPGHPPVLIKRGHERDSASRILGVLALATVFF